MCYNFQDQYPDNFWAQMAPSCIVALFVLVIPAMFSFLSRLSRYGSETAESGLKTRLAMYATLFKTLLLQIMVLIIVTFHFFAQSKDGKASSINDVTKGRRDEVLNPPKDWKGGVGSKNLELGKLTKLFLHAKLWHWFFKLRVTTLLFLPDFKMVAKTFALDKFLCYFHFSVLQVREFM